MSQQSTAFKCTNAPPSIFKHKDCDKALESALMCFVKQQVHPEYRPLFLNNKQHIIEAIKKGNQQPPSCLQVILEKQLDIYQITPEPEMENFNLKKINIMSTAPHLPISNDRSDDSQLDSKPFGESKKDQLLVAVICDVLALVSSLLGKWTVPSHSVSRNLIKLLAKDTTGMAKIAKNVNTFANANSAPKKAAALWRVFSALTGVLSMGTVIELMFCNLSWWEYAVITIVAAAQITLWLGSGGSVFIAEVTLIIMGSVQLIKDSVDFANCEE